MKKGSMLVYSLYEYEDKIRSLIIQYKDFGDRYLARVFLEPFAYRVSLFYHDYLVVCVPSTDLAFKERGFDHIRLMASFLNLKMIDSVLINVSQRKQKEKNREERLRIGESLKLVDAAAVRGKKILLIDDVMTTGSSVRACYDLLIPIAKRVVVLVVASVSDIV